MESPRISHSERLFSPPTGTHVLKRAESLAVRKTHVGNLLVTLPRFLRFLEGNLFRKSLTEFERSAQF